MGSMVSWRDEITLRGTTRFQEVGREHPGHRRRALIRTRDGERIMATDLEMDKREVSGLYGPARDRAWKGGLR